MKQRSYTSILLSNSVKGHWASWAQKNFYFSFLEEIFLFKNEILYFLHNKASIINLAYVLFAPKWAFYVGKYSFHLAFDSGLEDWRNVSSCSSSYKAYGIF